MSMGESIGDTMKYNGPCGEIGSAKVEKFIVSKKDAEYGRIRSIMSGRYVPEGEYHKLTVGGILMMSDTPDEIRDHIRIVCRAHGNCLVTGLGLGCVVRGMLETKSDSGQSRVDHITVIEKSQDVIDLIGPSLWEKYPYDKLSIICADALEWKPPKDAFYDIVWNDIWPYITGDNKPTMEKLHRKFGKKCGYQDSWQRYKVRELAKRRW